MEMSCGIMPQGSFFFGSVFHTLLHNLWKKDTTVEMHWKCQKRGVFCVWLHPTKDF
jgi:hypothetical protein